MTEANSDWLAEINSYAGRECGPQHGWDPVNAVMIRHWCEAMGDNNPIYTDADAAAGAGYQSLVAPPTMLQAWTMKGYGDRHPAGSSEENPFEVLTVLERYGYTGVVAVNCDQEYERYLQDGERVFSRCVVDDISEEKQTPLGSGFFVTAKYSFYVGEPGSADEELVGTMLFRVLKYKPAQQPAAKPEEEGTKPKSRKILRPRPGINRDNAFFWEGVSQGKLLIQRCTSCQSLRHPPGPMCPQCQSLEWDTAESSGKGVIYSFVNLHHPQVPPFDSPNPIALVELEEGTRIVAGLVGIKPKDVKIGLPVTVEFTQDEDLTLALFRPVEQA